MTDQSTVWKYMSCLRRRIIFRVWKACRKTRKQTQPTYDTRPWFEARALGGNCHEPLHQPWSLQVIDVIKHHNFKCSFHLNVSCLISGSNSLMRSESALSMPGQLIKPYFKLVLEVFSTTRNITIHPPVSECLEVHLSIQQILFWSLPSPILSSNTDKQAVFEMLLLMYLPTLLINALCIALFFLPYR